MKKHLNTDFRRFILEKLHNRNPDELDDDELIEVEPDDDIEDPLEDEDPVEIDCYDDDELDDDVINELFKEYKKIKKKHDLYKLHRRNK